MGVVEVVLLLTEHRAQLAIYCAFKITTRFYGAI